MFAGLHAFRQKDRGVFREVYDQLAPDLFKYLRKKSGNWMIAEDIMQESFIKLWLKAPTVKEATKIKPLLYTIAKNTLFDFRKRERRHRKREAVVRAHSPGALDPLHAESVMMDIMTILSSNEAKLSPKQKEICKLIWVDELSKDVVARQLGIHVNTVSSQLSQAKERLQKIDPDKWRLLMMLIMMIQSNK